MPLSSNVYASKPETMDIPGLEDMPPPAQTRWPQRPSSGQVFLETRNSATCDAAAGMTEVFCTPKMHGKTHEAICEGLAGNGGRTYTSMYTGKTCDRGVTNATVTCCVRKQ